MTGAKITRTTIRKHFYNHLGSVFLNAVVTQDHQQRAQFHLLGLQLFTNARHGLQGKATVSPLTASLARGARKHFAAAPPGAEPTTGPRTPSIRPGGRATRRGRQPPGGDPRALVPLQQPTRSANAAAQTEGTNICKGKTDRNAWTHAEPNLSRT